MVCSTGLEWILAVKLPLDGHGGLGGQVQGLVALAVPLLAIVNFQGMPDWVCPVIELVVAPAVPGGVVGVPDWLLLRHHAPVLLGWHLLGAGVGGDDGGQIAWHADNFSLLLGEPTRYLLSSMPGLTTFIRSI